MSHACFTYAELAVAKQVTAYTALLDYRKGVQLGFLGIQIVRVMEKLSCDII